MTRWSLLLYALASYLLFLVTTLYGVAFFGNLFVSRTIDAAASVPLGQALVVNSGLLGLFAVQHSGMARDSFKAWLGRRIPRQAVRSTYVLMSCLALLLLMFLWQPMGGVVWSVDGDAVRRLVMLLYFLGWALMVWATFLLDHWELFGLRQAWCAFRGGTGCAEPALQTPAAYRLVRHPIYTGWLIVLWAAPTMTVAHLVLAAGLTAYIVIGVRLEERDLAARLPHYEQYRRKVPMLLPSWRRRLAAERADD